MIQGVLDFLEATNSTFTWGVDNPYALEKLDPRQELLDVVRYADYDGFQYLPTSTRIVFWLTWHIPCARNIQLNMRFNFSQNSILVEQRESHPKASTITHEPSTFTLSTS
jgi:hypothetical protein